MPFKEIRPGVWRCSICGREEPPCDIGEHNKFLQEKPGYRQSFWNSKDPVTTEYLDSSIAPRLSGPTAGEFGKPEIVVAGLKYNPDKIM